MPLRTSPCAKAGSAAAETNGAMELMRMVLLGLTAAYYTISATMRLRWRRGHGRLHGRRRGEAHRLRRGRGGREHGRAAGARHREGHRRLPDGRFRLRGDGHRQGRRPHGALRQLTRWGQSPFASCHGFTPCLCVAIVSALYTPAGAKGYTPIATLHAMA